MAEQKAGVRMPQRSAAVSGKQPVLNKGAPKGDPALAPHIAAPGQKPRAEDAGKR